MHDVPLVATTKQCYVNPIGSVMLTSPFYALNSNLNTLAEAYNEICLSAVYRTYANCNILEMFVIKLQYTAHNVIYAQNNVLYQM